MPEKRPPPDQLIPAAQLNRGPRNAPPDTSTTGSPPAPIQGSEAERLERVPKQYQRPMVIKAVALAPALRRRELIIASIASAAAGCADIKIETEDGKCTCHAVCTCDTDAENTTNESERGRDFEGSVCVCDTVCRCDSVCTCDSEGGSSGGGGGSYWY